MRRGICPICDREYALTAKGGMRSHWAPPEIRRTVGYDCKGIGQPPKWTVADPVTEAVEAAEARGYQRAIDALRDTNALLTWWQAKYPERYLDLLQIADAAAYLEASAPDADPAPGEPVDTERGP